MVAFLRKKLKEKTIGHAGTLDPFATGLLIIGVGRESTKRLDEFKNLPKTYIATIRLGATSNTYDKTGTITNCHSDPPTGGEESLSQSLNGQRSFATTQDDNQRHAPSLKQIKKTIKSFIGKQLQTPPMFSAKKINGQKLYDLARKGIEIERKPCEIEIYDIAILDYSWPILKIEIKCSTGTYIRSLANDIGAKLGVGAYCEELVRTAIGEHNIGTAESVT